MISLIGASGHAKVILDILKAQGTSVNGFYDDNPGISELNGIPRLGSIQNLNHLENASFIICIGANATRKKIDSQFAGPYAYAIDPSTTLSPSATIGDGTVVMAGVVINAGSRIGRHCILNTQCSVDHDCLIEDFVHISPNACLTGGVEVGEGTHIGAGAVVIPGIKIGKWATIGAGSVVIRDVPDGATVVGNPARVIKL